MKKLSPHCSFKEAVYSSTAVKFGIKNEPTDKQLLNIVNLLNNVFEPLREAAKHPIAITSMFRSAALNKKIGGANSSQHLCNNGAAMDIDADVYGGVTNNQLFYYIKDNLEFDQLILEDVDEAGNGAWVHVSYNEGLNRKDVLVMKRVYNPIKKKNEIKYFPYVESEMELSARSAEEDEVSAHSNVC